MQFDWNEEKNIILKRERNIGFEDIVNAINENKILDVIKHPNFQKYPKQKIYIKFLDMFTWFLLLKKIVKFF
jgi:uncharacterized DUF497 family protein